MVRWPLTAMEEILEQSLSIPNMILSRMMQALQGNHPVSVAYDETLTDFNSEASVIAAGLKFFNIETSADVECGTCHDVHNSTNIEGLLWISNAGSALCLACHNK